MAQNLPRLIRPFTVALPAAHPQPTAAAEGRQRLAATAGVGRQAFTGHLWPSQGADHPMEPCEISIYKNPVSM